METRHVSHYILRNADAARKYRDRYFRQALIELNEVINLFGKYRRQNASWAELSAAVERLVDDLQEARYFGRWSIGWDITHPPKSVPLREIGIVDHIETAYSNVRSIYRMLRHEEAVKKVELALKQDGEKELAEHADHIAGDDENHIHGLLKSMQDRIQYFFEIYPELKKIIDAQKESH